MWVATLEKEKNPPEKSQARTETEGRENSETLCREISAGRLSRTVFTTKMYLGDFQGHHFSGRPWTEARLW